MATIYKRGKSWTIGWRDAAGQHQLSLGRITKRKAEGILARKQNELNAAKLARIPAIIPRGHDAKLTRVSPKPNSTGFRGVFRSGTGWSARITLNYKATHLGHFGDKESAAKAYDAAARKLHGDHARMNFPADDAISS